VVTPVGPCRTYVRSFGCYEDAARLRDILPLPRSKAESFRKSRMQVAFGVLRVSDGVVNSGYAPDKPCQNSFVDMGLSAAFFRSHSSAAAAKRDRLGTIDLHSHSFSVRCSPRAHRFP
jgi:hypothetical protein